MSSFTNEPEVMPIGSGRKWKVTKGFVYFLNDNQTGEQITISPGFITDFASVPRILWAAFPPYGRYGKAAIVHDYLYRIKCIGMRKVTKEEADVIFFNAMKVLKVPAWKRILMYTAVKYFGGYAWRM